MSEIRFVYNGTLSDAAADKIIESVLEALAVVDDAAVAFHEKGDKLHVGQRVKIINGSIFSGIIGEVVSIDKLYAVTFSAYGYGPVSFSENEIEPVESADDA